MPESKQHLDLIHQKLYQSPVRIHHQIYCVAVLPKLEYCASVKDINAIECPKAWCQGNNSWVVIRLPLIVYKSKVANSVHAEEDTSPPQPSIPTSTHPQVSPFKSSSYFICISSQRWAPMSVALPFAIFIHWECLSRYWVDRSKCCYWCMWNKPSELSCVCDAFIETPPPSCPGMYRLDISKEHCEVLYIWAPQV